MIRTPAQLLATAAMLAAAALPRTAAAQDAPIR
jgi:hypothetical protein